MIIRNLEDLHDAIKEKHDKIMNGEDPRVRATFPEDNPEHPDHDPAVAAAWAGKGIIERKIEVRLFTGILKKVRLEFLDADGKHVDHVDMTFDEYLDVCCFKKQVESLL